MFKKIIILACILTTVCARINAQIYLPENNGERLKETLEEGRLDVPAFSLEWIFAAHQFWMYRGEEEYMKTLLPTERNILSWFEMYLKEDNCLHNLPEQNFFHVSEADSAVLAVDTQGRNAFLDIMYILALKKAAEMESDFGNPGIGMAWRQTADRIGFTFRGWYWDNGRKMFADNSGRGSFSQHVNILAILAGIISGEEAVSLLGSILEDKTILQCSEDFSPYFKEARRVCLGPEPGEVVIIPLEAGFTKVLIEPSSEGITRYESSVQHPHGAVEVKCIMRKKHLTAEVNLPSGITGIFRWNGKEIALTGGKNKIIISK